MIARKKKVLFTFFLVGILILSGLFLFKFQLLNSRLTSPEVLAKEHVVIISTYGPEVGGPFYVAYMTKVMKYILDKQNKVKTIVIVGGYTVDASRSQAQAVLDYIQANFPDFKKQNRDILLEQCSITTGQNMVNAKQLLDAKGVHPDKITVFAETTRAKKVYFFAHSTFSPIPDLDSSLIATELKPLIALPQSKQLESYSHLNDYQVSKYTNQSSLVEVITQDSGLPKEYQNQEYSSFFQDIYAYLDPTFGKKQLEIRLNELSKAATFSVAENLVAKGCKEYQDYIK